VKKLHYFTKLNKAFHTGGMLSIVCGMVSASCT